MFLMPLAFFTTTIYPMFLFCALFSNTCDTFEPKPSKIELSLSATQKPLRISPVKRKIRILPEGPFNNENHQFTPQPNVAYL